MVLSAFRTALAAVLLALVVAPATAQAEAWAKKCNDNRDNKISDEYWIYFRTDGTHLDEEAVERIDRASSIGKARDVEQICIMGQASKEGDAAANRQLSYNRAQAVARAFVQRGWRADQIVVESKGEAWGFMSDWLTNDSHADRRVVVTYSY